MVDEEVKRIERIEEEKQKEEDRKQEEVLKADGSAANEKSQKES